MSSPAENLEDLEPGPVAGPTAMRKAHQNGMRKTLARVKPWLKPEQSPEGAIKVALLTYLKEWDKIYGEGTGVLALTQVERTVMVIRQDTVKQILHEIG